MRTFIGFLGSVLLFLGAACVVAELLHLVVGDGNGWLTLGRVWAGVHSGSLQWLQAFADGTMGRAGGVPLAWILALPSWLFLIAVGGLLAMLGGRGRERGGFG